MRFILSSLSRDENMNSRRLHPLRTPKERASRERQLTEMKCTAENASVFGENHGIMVWKSLLHPKKQLFKNKRIKIFTHEP